MQCRAIYVTPLTPTGSIGRNGRGLSSNAAGTGTTFQQRSGLPHLSLWAAVAGGFCLSDLRRAGAGNPAGSVALCELRARNFDKRRNDLPGQQTALDALVPGDVARD